MKDRVGKELKVGDSVAYVSVEYKELVLGTVHKITPKKIAVKTGSEVRYRENYQVIKYE